LLFDGHFAFIIWQRPVLTTLLANED